MTIKNLKIINTWRDVADAARTTINKQPGINEPSTAWKRWMLRAEHSPIRKLYISWTWENLPSWVSVHIVRHKIGIDHFISTQRNDRQPDPKSKKQHIWQRLWSKVFHRPYDRRKAPQDTPVNHECYANAQALINISRKRLCKQASPETTDAWQTFINELYQHDQELALACVPECVYRGFCPEKRSCGYIKTTEYENRLTTYRRK